MALFAEVEVKAVFAFVSHPDNRHHLTAVAFHIFADLATWLHDQLYAVGFVIVASNFEFVVFSGSRKITILAKTKVIAVCTNKTASYDRPHVAGHTFVLVVSC